MSGARHCLLTVPRSARSIGHTILGVQMRKFALSFVLVFFACVTVSAQSPSASVEPPVGETPFAFFAMGARSAEGTSLNIQLQVVSGEPFAIRIFSEPSHTLLAAFADNSSGDPRQATWFHDVFPAPVPLMRVPLTAGSKALQQARSAPVADKKLSFHMYGIWPGEQSPRDGVINVITNPNDFRFTLKQYSVTGMICCDIAPDQCGGGCLFCGRGVDTYRCCKFHTNSGCGWCNDVHTECSADPCPEC